MLLEGLHDSLILTCSSVCQHLGFFVSVSHLSLAMQALTSGQASCAFAGFARCISEMLLFLLDLISALALLLCAHLISVHSGYDESC